MSPRDLGIFSGGARGDECITITLPCPVCALPARRGIEFGIAARAIEVKHGLLVRYRLTPATSSHVIQNSCPSCCRLALCYPNRILGFSAQGAWPFFVTPKINLSAKAATRNTDAIINGTHPAILSIHSATPEIASSITHQPTREARRSETKKAQTRMILPVLR